MGHEQRNNIPLTREQIGGVLVEQFWKSDDIPSLRETILSPNGKVTKVPVVIYPHHVRPLLSYPSEILKFFRRCIRSKFAQAGAHVNDSGEEALDLASPMWQRLRSNQPIFYDIDVVNFCSRPVAIQEGQGFFRIYNEDLAPKLVGRKLYEAVMDGKIHIEDGRFAWVYKNEGSENMDDIIALDVDINHSYDRWIPPEDNRPIYIPSYGGPRGHLDHLLKPVKKISMKKPILYLTITPHMSLASDINATIQPQLVHKTPTENRKFDSFQTNSRVLDGGRTDLEVLLEVFGRVDSQEELPHSARMKFYQNAS